jgi:hypothetical protein
VGRRSPGCLALHRAWQAAAAIIESFIGRLRDEMLNETLFLSLADAHAKLEAWRIDYNTNRPTFAARLDDANRIRRGPTARGAALH